MVSPLADLNLQHLRYFWAVARHGSVAAACRQLHVAQPTISGQVRKLERAMQTRLFMKRGRGVALTETGELVFRYADEMFLIADELAHVIGGRAASPRAHLRIGVADVLPKFITYRLLQPALREFTNIRMTVREDNPGALLASLAAHALDFVVTDAPLGASHGVRGYNHYLGESPLAVFAPRALAARLKPHFPQSLEGAPFLVPMRGTSARRAIDYYFEENKLKPMIAGEFDDSALLNTFAQGGAGAFASPIVIAREICKQYDVEKVGEMKGALERYYAISPDRRIQHPAVRFITENARNLIFNQ